MSIANINAPQPLISVIVRTQNRPYLLQRALQSLHEQSYPAREVVIINDGGKNIANIVEKYQNQLNIQLIQHDAIKGRAAAANTGLHAAQGEWIAFLDDDDTFDPDGIEKLARYIAWDKDMIYGQVQVVQMAAEPEKIVKAGIFGDPFDADRLLLENYIPICAYLCKKDLALSIGGFDTEFTFLEDWEFLFRLSRQTNFHYVPELVSNYCIWGEAYATGKNAEQEIYYRTLLFQKHLSLFTPEILRKASLASIKHSNRRSDEAHARFQQTLETVQAQYVQTTHQIQITHAQELQQLHAAHAQEVHQLNLRYNEAHQQWNADYQKLAWQLDAEVAKIQKIAEDSQVILNENKQLADKLHEANLEVLGLREQVATQVQATDHLHNQWQEKYLQLQQEHLQHIETQSVAHQQHINEYHAQCHYLQVQVNTLTADLQAQNQQWQARIQQWIWRLASHLAFVSGEVLDLSNYGVMPSMRLFIAETCEMQEVVPILVGTIQAPLPILSGKSVYWKFSWQNAEPTQVILLRLGTCGRVNHCHLKLLVFQQCGEELLLCNAAYLEGSTARDNSYNAFLLDKPLKAGQYKIQLTSPDADNLNNTLCVWLTLHYSRIGGNIIKNYRYVSPNRLNLQTALAKLSYQPLISIVMPVYNTPKDFLIACIDSVIQQVYPHWELCIADDASTESYIQELLDFYQEKYPQQIKIVYRPANGHISAATNSAIHLASGEYIALLDHDDVLTGDALMEVVNTLNLQLEKGVSCIDLVYSDEDKLDEGGGFDEPFFKPAWSPENLKGQMYIGHLGVYRKQIVDEIGGFRVGYEGSQDWDLALRFTEKTQRIVHIPKILYHWRKHRNSTAANIDNKEYAVKMGLKVVQEALDRDAEGGIAKFNRLNNCLVVHYPVATDIAPLVSIIIPTKDHAQLLADCLASICGDNPYPNWEVVVVDNGSKEEATFALFAEYREKLDKQFSVIACPGAFNFAYLVNQGVNAAKGQFLLLLNNDTKLLAPVNWLEEMVGYAQRQQIACVGIKLLYPDNTLQHAGVVCGIGGVANHSHLNHALESPGYFSRLTIVSNYSAVTAACLMIRRELWELVGGFDEKLAVAFNDVDFCLRLWEKGYRHVILPQVLFYHYESKSRGYEDTPEKLQRFHKEVAYMQQRWKTILDDDPYYNVNLSKFACDFSIDLNSTYHSNNDEELQ
jgi:glycosyltransferase involved in cell wall biosynthesis